MRGRGRDKIGEDETEGMRGQRKERGVEDSKELRLGMQQYKVMSNMRSSAICYWEEILLNLHFENKYRFSLSLTGMLT